MCWFLRGDTNVKYLQDNNVRIWDEWATAEQTAKFGRPEGELGPVYGKQWRFYGAEEPPYDCVHNLCDGPCECVNSLEEQFCNLLQERQAARKTGNTNIGVVGIDQIQRVVDRIKTNPSCRRLIVSAWNPAECDKVALPPCHTLFQFRVSHGGTRLNCQLYQRSADAAVGVPFNIASYALLTHMIAHVTGLEVGEFIHTFGDLHIYEDHVSGVKEQLTREPLPLAKLWLNPDIRQIDDFKPEDIKLVDYTSHPAIPFSVAV
jgi:thymidylate synthase